MHTETLVLKLLHWGSSAESLALRPTLRPALRPALRPFYRDSSIETPGERRYAVRSWEVPAGGERSKADIPPCSACTVEGALAGSSEDQIRDCVRPLFINILVIRSDAFYTIIHDGPLVLSIFQFRRSSRSVDSPVLTILLF